MAVTIDEEAIDRIAKIGAKRKKCLSELVECAVMRYVAEEEMKEAWYGRK